MIAAELEFVETDTFSSPSRQEYTALDSLVHSKHDDMPARPVKTRSASEFQEQAQTDAVGYKGIGFRLAHQASISKAKSYRVRQSKLNQNHPENPILFVKPPETLQQLILRNIPRRTMGYDGYLHNIR